MTSSAATVIRMFLYARPGRGSSSLQKPETAGEARIRSRVHIIASSSSWPGKIVAVAVAPNEKQVRRDAFGEADAHREILREAEPNQVLAYDRPTVVGSLGNSKRPSSAFTSPVKDRRGAVMICTSARSPT